VAITENAMCILNPKKTHLLSFKMDVLFLFMITAGTAINFYFAVQIFFIGKGTKAVITSPHFLLGISFIGFGLGVLIT